MRGRSCRGLSGDPVESGGLLAPMFMAGAALGGGFAVIVDRIVPGTHLSPAACALAGMAAAFGAAARALSR